LKIKATLRSGKEVEIAFLDSGDFPGKPLLSTPIDISGFGQVWVNSQWQSRLENCLYQAEQTLKNAEFQKIVEEIMKDFPGFLKHVQWIEFHDAVEKEYSMMPESDRAVVRDVLSLLDAESTKPDPKAGMGQDASRNPALMLSPGTGFTLPLVFTNGRTALVPGWGTIVFKKDVLPKIREKIPMPKAAMEDDRSVTVKPSGETSGK
jgi:hypothetical protein